MGLTESGSVKSSQLQAASVSPVSWRQKAARRKKTGSSLATRQSSRAVSEARFHDSLCICAASLSSSTWRFFCASAGSSLSSNSASSANPNSSHPVAACSVACKFIADILDHAIADAMVERRFKVQVFSFKETEDSKTEEARKESASTGWRGLAEVALASLVGHRGLAEPRL